MSPALRDDEGSETFRQSLPGSWQPHATVFRAAGSLCFPEFLCESVQVSTEWRLRPRRGGLGARVCNFQCAVAVGEDPSQRLYLRGWRRRWGRRLSRGCGVIGYGWARRCRFRAIVRSRLPQEASVTGLGSTCG